METLNDHYRLLLGLDEAWAVEDVNLDLPGLRVEIKLRFVADRCACPECGALHGRADLADERRWRHLDTMQFETVIAARIPRSRCPEHGVKTIRAPWAEPHSRFTLLFEAFAIAVLQATANVASAAKLLSLDWKACNAIMTAAVERGLQRRKLEGIDDVGIDEKSFRRGHRYVSVMTDLSSGRVLEVAEGRDTQAAKTLWNALPDEQRGDVKGAAMDMWQPYVVATQAAAPEAKIVHDKYHVAAHLNAAVDQTRRSEHKRLLAVGDDRLKGTKHRWLYGPARRTPEDRRTLEKLRRAGLKTGRAWALKEDFRWFWRCVYPESARTFFQRWHAWAARSRLPAMAKAARMLKARLPNLLNYFRRRITNAKAESVNGRIQSLKASARGFHDFASYRVRILFHLGRLDLSITP